MSVIPVEAPTAPAKRMAPIVGAALISTGGGLLNSLFGGGSDAQRQRDEQLGNVPVNNRTSASKVYENDLARQLGEFIEAERARNTDADALYRMAQNLASSLSLPIGRAIMALANERAATDPSLVNTWLTRNNLKPGVSGGRPTPGGAAVVPVSEVSLKLTNADGSHKPWWGKLGTFALWALLITAVLAVLRLVWRMFVGRRRSGGGANGGAVSYAAPRARKRKGIASTTRAKKGGKSSFKAGGGDFKFDKPMSAGPFAGRSYRSLSAAERRTYKNWKKKGGSK